MEFLFVDQVQCPVRDEQPVADHQGLPSIIDHHLGRLMIVVGRRLLGVNGGGAEGQREENEQRGGDAFRQRIEQYADHGIGGLVQGVIPK